MKRTEVEAEQQEASACDKAYFLTIIKMPLLFRVGKKGWKSQVQSPTIPRVVQESVMLTSPLPHHMTLISVVEDPL